MNLKQVYSINMSMLAYVVSDVLVKHLGQICPSIELIFWRSCMIAGSFGLVLIARRKLLSKNLLKPALIGRCVFDCINAFSIVIALVHLDLAEIYAIMLLAPFLTTVLAAIFLKEHVGWRRWLAIVGGFAGSLLIVKPSAHAFNYWAAVAFLAALSSSLRDFTTAKIHPGTSIFEATFVSAVFTAAIGVLFSIGQPWKSVVAYDAYLLVAMVTAWLMGAILLIYACRTGPLIVVASFRFMLLVWGGVAGYLVFDNIPDLWTLTGAAIIVMCALYIFYREGTDRRLIA